MDVSITLGSTGHKSGAFNARAAAHYAQPSLVERLNCDMATMRTDRTHILLKPGETDQSGDWPDYLQYVSRVNYFVRFLNHLCSGPARKVDSNPH
jgi:hypothetical protein